MLAFSYIGYQTVEIKAGGKGLDRIVLMEDNELLDEVVVVGYGVQKKRDVTTAIASLRASDMKRPTGYFHGRGDGGQDAGCAGVSVDGCSGLFLAD